MSVYKNGLIMKANVTILLLFFIFSKDGIAQQGTKRPNVLLIMVDDLNDWVGCMNGHPNALTPNIDRLAEQGMLFTNAHAAAPICSPSRTALLSGVAPYRSGVYMNADGWHMSKELAGIDFLPLHFRNNGYHTMMGGKIFHSRPVNLDEAFDENVGNFGGINANLVSKEYTYPFEELYGIYHYAAHWGPLDKPESDQLSDQKIAAWAIEKLDQHYEKPFFLSVGFYRPHVPLTAPREFYDRFKNEKTHFPPIKEHDLDDVPFLGQQIALGGYQETQNGHYKQFTERGLQMDYILNYLASTSFVDAKIGSVLDALGNSQYKDNTVVILVSDNGWSLGQQTHFEKWTLWETTTKVPLIVRYPGMSNQGKKSASPVNLLDIFPTLISMCGLPLPDHTLDGQSLVPLLENPDIVSEKPSIITLGQGNHSARDQHWRYIRYADGSEELYNHRKDPSEWNNLAGKKQYKKTIQALAKWLPKENAMAVNTDHDFPIRLTPADNLRNFNSPVARMINQPIAIKATIGPKITDGIIVAHGSQFTGYALYVKDGKLKFSVMNVPTPIRWDNLFPYRNIIETRDKLPQDIVKVKATLAKNGEIALWINDEQVANGMASTLVMNPNGFMMLGEAHKDYVPVGDYKPPFKFEGEIEEVMIDLK
jgi:arylsulfatase A-like enzyme